MKFKWPIVILCGLGLMAAVSAALLAAFWSSRPIQGLVEQLPDPEIPVLVAARDIEAGMTALREEDIDTKMVLRANAPRGHFSDATQVIGLRPNVDIIKGQAFSPLLFPLAGSGPDLAGTLQEGMRAVSISMAGASGLVGLLYPGSRVDILATFRLSGQEGLGSAVSTTLLENIEVIAVQNVTAAAAQRQAQAEAADGGTPVLAAAPQGGMITVLVTNEQAQFLHLATGNGSVSMAMRNPTDSAPVNADSTILDQGRIARMAEVLTIASEEREDEPPASGPAARVEPARAEPPPRNLTVVVIRGTIPTVLTPEAFSEDSR